MANYDDEDLSNAQDDVDEAMGYGKNINDDWGTAFFKAYNATTYRGSPEGKATVAAAAKQRILNKLSLELEERKLQLAQKYKPYEQFVKTPYGAVWGVGQQAPKELIPEDKNLRALEEAKQRKEIAEANYASDPQVLGAKKEVDLARPGLLKAQTENFNFLKDYKSEMAKVAAQRAAQANQPKPKAMSYEDSIDTAAKETGVDIKDFQFQRMLMKGDKRALDVMNRIKQRAAEIYKANSGGLAAPAGEQSTQPAGPDINDIMNLQNSPYFQAQPDMFSQ